MIDTHTHIYAEEFDDDRAEAIARAKNAGVTKMILPNIDSESIDRMLLTEAQNPDFCFAAMGLHPTSVNETWRDELEIVRKQLNSRKWIAVGEIGIDLYWDKTFEREQAMVFAQQVEWALEFDLPIIIHVRNSFAETMQVLENYRNKGLRGVFHSFGGSVEEAQQIIDFKGFKMGINGIVTFKNSGLRETLQVVDIQYIVLETDAPYLTPVPHRGTRNESAYLTLMRAQLAETYKLTEEKIDEITTQNARELFFL
jgi:TatD DNase family protein